MSGISVCTYRVPDSTPISTSLVYNSDKFYGMQEYHGQRKALLLKDYDCFVASDNPTSFKHNSMGSDTFEGWKKWLKEHHKAEIQAFDSLLELVKWMHGGK